MSRVNIGDPVAEPSQRGNEGRKYALVVGVNKSPNVLHLSELRYAESDAISIAHFLSRRECNFALPTSALLGEAATVHNVRTAVNILIRGKSENDLLLFYFIGHGYAGIESEIFLVTSDFDPHQARHDPDAYISLGWIRRTLYERQRRASIISILDCCYAGDIGEPQIVGLLTTVAANIQRAESSSNRTWAVLASTREDAVAYEHTNNRGEGHALMTGLVLEALSGDAWSALDRNGHLVPQTLHAYLQVEMKKLQS